MIGMGEWGLSLQFACITKTQVAALKDAHLSPYRLLFQFPFHACESICAAAQLLLLPCVCWLQQAKMRAECGWAQIQPLLQETCTLSSG